MKKKLMAFSHAEIDVVVRALEAERRNMVHERAYADVLARAQITLRAFTPRVRKIREKAEGSGYPLNMRGFGGKANYER